jgi:hypothetical protein
MVRQQLFQFRRGDIQVHVAILKSAAAVTASMHSMGGYQMLHGAYMSYRRPAGSVL